MHLLNLSQELAVSHQAGAEVRHRATKRHARRRAEAIEVVWGIWISGEIGAPDNSGHLRLAREHSDPDNGQADKQSAGDGSPCSTDVPHPAAMPRPVHWQNRCHRLAIPHSTDVLPSIMARRERAGKPALAILKPGFGEYRFKGRIPGHRTFLPNERKSAKRGIGSARRRSSCAMLRSACVTWAGLRRRYPAQARQVIRLLLGDARWDAEPFADASGQGYRLRGRRATIGG